MRKRSVLRSSCYISALFLLSLPASAQLVIEGGPFGTRISDRDGKIDGAVASSNRDYVITGRSMTRPRNPGLTDQYRSVRTSSNVINRTLGTVPEITSTRVNPIGISRFQEIDFAKGRQLARMERDLIVLKTTREAGMEFPQSRLFYSGQSTLTSSGQSLLDQIATYHAAARGGSFTIGYHYDPRSDSPTLGGSRAWAIVSYLSEKTGLSFGWFTTPEPEPVKPRVNSDGRVIATGSLVKISFQRSR